MNFSYEEDSAQLLSKLEQFIPSAGADSVISDTIRNTTENQMGQKCWVKVTYNAPTEPNLNIPKNKCACNSPNSTFDFEKNGFNVFPNPVVDFL